MRRVSAGPRSGCLASALDSVLQKRRLWSFRDDDADLGVVIQLSSANETLPSRVAPQLRNACRAHGARWQLTRRPDLRRDLRASLGSEVVLEVLGDLRAHEVLRLVGIVDVDRPELAAVARMGVQVD